MCGIAGVVGIGGLDPNELNDLVLPALEHRGPDDMGVIHGEGFWLGMRRLAIIDLETGKQPLTNEDGTISAVLNGEIYNYRELRRDLIDYGHIFRTQSDTEVLPHLYERNGHELCSDLNGMFAFAIWDAKRQRLVLGRDRVGKKPLYFARSPGGGLVFASELKALRPLMRVAAIPCRLSHQAIYDYLSLGVVPQPSTVYVGVESMPPGHTLQWQGGQQTVARYWQLEVQPKIDAPPADLRRKLRAAVGAAVEIRLRSDVPLGVFLSSGIDSTVVAIEAARRLGGDLSTFTIGVDDPLLDESYVASRTAAALGTRHEVLKIAVAPVDEVFRIARHFDQPFADPSAIPSLAVARLARQYVKVVLNGDGGDEIFGGYRRYWAAEFARRFPFAERCACSANRIVPQAAPDARRKFTGFLGRLARGLELTGGARYLAWTTDFLVEADKERWWRGEGCYPTEEWLERMIPMPLDGLDAFAQADVRVNLLSDLLVKMDMATMAASIEARSPLLDHRVVELAFRTPASSRVGVRKLKALLRDAFWEELPPEVRRAPKRGFEVPILKWIRHDLDELIRDVVLAPDACTADFLDRKFIENVVGGQLLRERNWQGFVYAILMLELWLREAA